MSRGKQLTTEEFIEKARKVHGDKYDYSKVDYVNNKTKISIICPEHGEWLQRPNSHLRGAICPICSNRIVADRKRLTQEEFIEKARKVHGDKYNYSKVNYVDAHTKICIICPNDGEFWQEPYSHLKGNGCRKCPRKHQKDTEQFIQKAKEIHGDKYDYSKVELKSVLKKVCIICPEHGEFWQIPSAHYRGSGCPICKTNHYEREIGELLKENGIKYIAQHRFEWLGLQSLDFYLPDYNIAIECQGLQHFKYIPFFEKKHGENITKKRDIIKKQKCEEYNVKILYYSDLKYDFPYEVFTDKHKLLVKIKSFPIFANEN